MARTNAEILLDIEKWKTKLLEAEDAYSSLLKSVNSSNSFSDGEGSQSLSKRRLQDQQEAIDWIEDKLKRLNAELLGKTTVVRHMNRRDISQSGIYL